jgi:hypothetical protein
MTAKFGIQITDSIGTKFVLLAEGKDGYQTFSSYKKADDYNYEFEQTLEDGLTSTVIVL